ncbi:MAG: aldehyde ferredoxin oxidoreductase family protein [Promethearchaeota archaeon]
MAQIESQNDQESSLTKGYMGKVLWVNLTQKSIKEETPPMDIYKKFFGGYGLGVYYIYTRIKPNCDPLGPDNILGFCPGLMTGTVAPFTGRYMVCGKSPLTGRGEFEDGFVSNGGWGDANSGGYFGPAIKRAGYDAIFFTGISENPVYLLIDGENKELVDADTLWGKDVVETEKILKEKHGKNVNVASIGIGGENLVKFAGIVNDAGRIAARSGLGAVMGSKKLKAICIKGNKRITYHNKQAAMEHVKKYSKMIQKSLNKKLLKYIVENMASFSSAVRALKIPLTILGKSSQAVHMYRVLYHLYGTPKFTPILVDIGDSPIMNFKGTRLDFSKKDAEKISSNSLDKYKIKEFGCFSCPIRCGAIIRNDEIGLEESHRPEYESVGAFGPLIMNNDLNTLLKLNHFANIQGIDSISLGGVIAFALDCVDEGLLKKEDFKCKEKPDGFLPKFKGSPSDIILLAKLIANREGIGDILALGVKEASKRIKGSEKLANHSAGQEIPMHDPRLMHGLAITYVADPTPGRHTAAGVEFFLMGPVNEFIDGLNVNASIDPKKMGTNQAKFAKFMQATNALGFCEFALWFGRYPLLELIEAFFGWKMDLNEILEIGYRIQTLRQMFNAREGAIWHELAPRVMGDPPLQKGPLKNSSLDIEPYIREYYNAMGYREDGVPLKATLKSLNLDFCLNDLKIARGRPKPLINNYLLNKSKK